MAVCPKGHTSEATDYCDECGAPIGGSAPPSTVESPAVEPAAGPSGDACPECGTARDGRFCEVCGHDFLAEVPAGATAAGPSTVAGSGTSPAGAAPVGAAPAEAVAAGVGTGAGSGPTAGPGTAWRVVAAADRGYYDRMRTEEPDADPVAFPPYCPERRFTLTGTEVLIGRLSRSRGIEPGIDLTGPPEDAGVSHAHALFVSTPDGWSVVDLDSANGTYLNDAPEPLTANQPVPLSAGDRVHVGAWTTLTIQPT